MKLAFLCSSLEAGRDGVGDYTRGFAVELLSLGHEVCLVALSDKFVDSAVEGDEPAGTKAVRTLRLAAGDRWQRRIALAREFLDAFEPDWVSLQFVSYGHQEKGIVYGLARRLKPLVEGRRLHLMFHEIWLGDSKGTGWKFRLLGAAQRLFIRRFVRCVRPDAIHTSNSSFQALLAHRGIPAGVLPLFGAIPVRESPKFGWIEEQLRATAGGDFHRDQFWLFGIFGGLYANWPPEPLLPFILEAARRARKNVALIAVGRIGEGEELWERMVRQYAQRIGILRLGEQPSERVSEVLSMLDYGIATTPWLILGKSSTVASMLEHGLPVIVNRNDVQFHIPVVGPGDRLLIQCDEDLVQRLVAGIPKGPRGSRRGPVVRDFLSSLQGQSRC